MSRDLRAGLAFLAAGLFGGTFILSLVAALNHEHPPYAIVGAGLLWVAGLVISLTIMWKAGSRGC